MDRREIIAKQIIKYGIFVLAVFVLYILQSAPGFLQIFGIKPVFVIPFCVTLSMLDESPSAGIVYVTGGLLTDLSGSRVVGTFSIPLIIACVCGVIAVKFFFKPSSRNSCFFSFFSMAAILTANFVFTYIMAGGYTSKLIFYFKHVVLLSAYSALFSLVFYGFIDFINKRFMRFDAR